MEVRVPRREYRTGSMILLEHLDIIVIGETVLADGRKVSGLPP
jgi:hypothetical protein